MRLIVCAAFFLTAAVASGQSVPYVQDPLQMMRQYQQQEAQTQNLRAQTDLLNARTQAMRVYQECINSARGAACGPVPDFGPVAPAQRTDYDCVQRNLPGPSVGYRSSTTAAQDWAAAMKRCTF